MGRKSDSRQKADTGEDNRQAAGAQWRRGGIGKLRQGRGLALARARKVRSNAKSHNQQEASAQNSAQARNAAGRRPPSRRPAASVLGEGGKLVAIVPTSARRSA